ncbi:MAG TPA: serine/threonine-protein kinase [Candidatus Polarisedimenticolaceae bacterium]|nr:serine/threonine-protein kinase [Candidatus Polarisedimenticolaceae bacterium]
MPQPREISGSVRLTILRKLASGGMGRVYLGVQHGAEGFRKTVAIKTILDRFSRDSRFARMFVGEAQLVADLVHQNIVQVYHLGRHGRTLYIVMEFVEGVNLREFIQHHRERAQRIPIELAAFIASRVCRGLEYAHRKTGPDGAPLGIVHRDVSPKNILITRLGEVKLGDFGVAKARQMMSEREGHRLVGKYAYMSPEQARLEPTDNRSDLYSLGLVLWEMLAGRRPFEGAQANRAAWLARTRGIPVPPLPDEAVDVPPMLREVLSQAVAPDPAERYQDAGKMGYDLEYFMYHKGYGPTIVTLQSYLQEQALDHAVRQDDMPDTISDFAPDDGP